MCPFAGRTSLSRRAVTPLIQQRCHWQREAAYTAAFGGGQWPRWSLWSIVDATSDAMAFKRRSSDGLEKATVWLKMVKRYSNSHYEFANGSGEALVLMVCTYWNTHNYLMFSSFILPCPVNFNCQKFMEDSSISSGGFSIQNVRDSKHVWSIVCHQW